MLVCFVVALKFGKILKLRTINIILFDAFLLVNLFYLKYDITNVVIVFLIITAITSVISLVNKWDGVYLIRKSNKATINKICLLIYSFNN